MSELASQDQLDKDSDFPRGRIINKQNDRRLVAREIEEGVEEFENGEYDFFDYPGVTEDWDDQEIARAEYLEDQLIVEMPRQAELAELADQIDEEDEERHAAFYKKYAQHQEQLDIMRTRQTGAAKIIHSVTEAIRTNPDSTVAELLQIVTELNEGVGLSPFELLSFRSAINSYVKKHKTAEEYFESSSAEAIYATCFGFSPQGKVEMSKGSMTLSLRCYDANDYARAYYFNSQTMPQLSEAEIKHATSSAGLAFGAVAEPRLHGIITMENAATQTLDGKARSQVEKHEEQHQINKLFSPVEYKMTDDYVFTNVLGDPKLTMEQALTKFVRNRVRLERRRIGIDARARDELIAYYADGTSIDDAVNTLMTSKLYDYVMVYLPQLAQLHKGIPQDLETYLYRIEGADNPPIAHPDMTADMVKPLIDPAIAAAVSRDPGGDYETLLKRWARAVKLLEEENYSRERILAFMYENPASDWWSLALSLSGRKPKFSRGSV